jgi:hypothetical protein
MPEEMSDIVSTWLSEIQDSKKREKNFRNRAETILEIYNGDDPNKIPFNILYSNTETLLPALFSNTPRPIVKRRFTTEESPLVGAGAKSATRMLEYLLDTNVDGYARFDETMTSVVLDGLLPGRGTSTIKYDASISEYEEDEETSESVEYEAVCLESEKWDRVFYGYAHKWENVPWIAYEKHLDKDESTELFGAEITNNIKFTQGEDKDDEGDPSEEVKHIGERETALVYQIWDKSDKKIKYISPQYKSGYLKEQDDELKITGFFNCPRPLQFVEKSNDLLPTALYTLYQNQANELNEIQRRLNTVIKAIKARGLYDGAISDDLEAIMENDDAWLSPTDKGSSLIDGGLAKAIWFMPIGELVATAQQLYQARESAKRVIQEITGISDILRGQSAASETLGAQKIKESWGTMRIKRLQRRVQEYSRDALRIMLDVAVQKLSQDTWIKVTGLPYPTNENREKARQMLQQMKIQAQQQALQAQQMGQQLPPPQPPDPQLVQTAQSPSWEEILEFLQDDYIRSYKVDIETNSTLDAEATEDKQMIGDFMNAMGQFMNGVMPMVQQGIMPFGAMKSMLQQISRRFRFGDEVDDQLNAMKEPKPQSNPEVEQAQKQLQSDKQALMKKAEQFNQEQQKVQENFKNEANQLKMDRMQFDFEKKLAQEKMKMDQQINMIKLNSDQKEADEKLKSIMKDNERKMQSMLDKHMNAVKDMNRPEPQQESGDINIAMPQPSGTKNIQIQRDGGVITGAMVVEGEIEVDNG